MPHPPQRPNHPSCHPRSARSSAVSAGPLHRRSLVFTVLLEPGATWVATVVHGVTADLGKPGCSRAEPSLYPSSTVVHSPCPHRAAYDRCWASPSDTLLGAAFSHALTHPPGPHGDDSTLLGRRPPRSWRGRSPPSSSGHMVRGGTQGGSRDGGATLPRQPLQAERRRGPVLRPGPASGPPQHRRCQARAPGTSEPSGSRS